MNRTITAVDAFCGAGGTSTGLALACRDMGVKVDLLAINHWDVAVRTHATNHPWARHLHSRLESVRPRDALNPPVWRIEFRCLTPPSARYVPLEAAPGVRA